MRPRNMKFGLQRVSIWVNVQKKFQVPQSHSIGELCDASFKISAHFSWKLCDLGTWNFGLQTVPIWVNIQKKFQVSRSHSIEVTWDASFKLSSHFSRNLWDRGTWNLVCKQYPYGLIYKINFNFLGRTVSEKNAMLISSYHFIFLETVRQRNIKFGLQTVSIWVNIQKKFKFLGRTVSGKVHC